MEKDFEELVKEYQREKEAGAEAGRMTELLREIMEISYDGRLMYELALWYWKDGYPARAKRTCKQIRQFFREGEWADRAGEALGLLDGDEDLPEILERTWLSGETAAKDAEKEKEAPRPEKNGSGPQIPPVIEEAFRGMVGMESVKKELVSFYNIARLERLREEQLGISGNESRSYNFVLYGNPGTGKTTVARIIGKVLYALGIREKDAFMEVDRGKLVSEYVGQTAKNVQKALAEIRGGTLFIDEAYSLYKKDDAKDFGQEAIDTLLKDMEDHRSEYSVILAGYRGPMTEMLNHANPGFRSRFTYHIVIPDYSDEELLEIARSVAGSHHYIIEEKGYEALKKRIDRERIDETFGNARFIREVINDAEKNLADRLVKMGHFEQADLTVLKAEDIFPEEDQGKDLKELLAELDGLTGLAEVKKSVSEMLDKIAVGKEAERRGIQGDFGMGSLHMAFKGNAGTGKTTVARLLGKILAEMGVLKRGDVFIETTRADLVGQYQGHTAAKVKETVRSALGGVLFIDEAYALVKDESDSFGREAVDTLVAEMENHRDALVVILAGYTGDIDRFLAENQGLRSRVTRDLFFADYTAEEMTEIFCSLAKKGGIRIPEAVLPSVRRCLEEKASAPDFGNGRGVRNVFEAVCRRKDSRIAARMREGGGPGGRGFCDIHRRRYACIGGKKNERCEKPVHGTAGSGGEMENAGRNE